MPEISRYGVKRILSVNYDRLFKPFIHKESQTDSITFTTSKILFTVVFLFFVSLLFYNFYFIYHGDYLSLKASINYFGLFFISILLLSIRWYKNLKIPLCMLSAAGFLLINAGIYQAGGIHSNDLYWFMVLVISNILFVGYKESVIILILSIVSLTVFYLSEVHFSIAIPAIDSASSVHYKFFNTVFITFIVSLLSFYLISGNQKLQRVKSIIQEEKIRTELASDFHDQIGNKLAALIHLSKFAQSTSDPDASARALGQLEKYADEVYGDFKDFLWTQEQGNRYLDELVDYLKDFMEEYLKMSGVKFVTRRLPPELPHVRIPVSYAKALIPVYKEALANMLKYARAQNCCFEVRVEETNVYFTLKDDGIGLDRTGKLKGNGIRNMRKRISKLDNTELIIDSERQGTAICVVIDKKSFFI